MFSEDQETDSQNVHRPFVSIILSCIIGLLSRTGGVQLATAATPIVLFPATFHTSGQGRLEPTGINATQPTQGSPSNTLFSIF